MDELFWKSHSHKYFFFITKLHEMYIATSFGKCKQHRLFSIKNNTLIQPQLSCHMFIWNLKHRYCLSEGSIIRRNINFKYGVEECWSESELGLGLNGWVRVLELMLSGLGLGLGLGGTWTRTQTCWTWTRTQF